MHERIAAQVNWMEVESVCLVKTAARFGILRLFDPFGLRKQPSGELRKRSRASIEWNRWARSAEWRADSERRHKN